MTDTIETAARGFMEMFDRKDFAGMLAAATQDVQGVDEISRGWLRGRDAAASYFDMLGQAVSDIHTEVSDVHEQVWGDTALATFWVEQDYKFQGAPVHASAPITMVFREEGGWKLALISAVALPPEA